MTIRLFKYKKKRTSLIFVILGIFSRKLFILFGNWMLFVGCVSVRISWSSSEEKISAQCTSSAFNINEHSELKIWLEGDLKKHRYHTYCSYFNCEVNSFTIFSTCLPEESCHLQLSQYIFFMSSFSARVSLYPNLLILLEQDWVLLECRDSISL